MVYRRESIVYDSLQMAGELDDSTARVETLWLQLRRGRLHQPQYNPAVVRPAVDVYQTQDAVVVMIELPGMRDQEVRLEIEAGRLTIWGEKRGHACHDPHVYNQMEIACGTFSRTVDLPSEVDPERVSFSYDDGYIEIHLPRVPRRSERRVRMTLRQL